MFTSYTITLSTYGQSLQGRKSRYAPSVLFDMQSFLSSIGAVNKEWFVRLLFYFKCIVSIFIHCRIFTALQTFVWKIFYHFELNRKERTFENARIFIVRNEIETILLNFNIAYGGEMIPIKIHIAIIMRGSRIFFRGGGVQGIIVSSEGTEVGLRVRGIFAIIKLCEFNIFNFLGVRTPSAPLDPRTASISVIGTKV